MRVPPRRAKQAAQGRIRPRAGALLISTIALILGGCADPLSRVDAKTDKLLRDRSASLGGGAIAPETRARSIADQRRNGQASTELETDNPGAEELPFNAAAADRDVAERLEKYADESLGSGEGAHDARLILLEDAFRLAQSSGREHRLAEEDYILAAIRLLIERHLWGPRLFNDTSVTLSGAGDNGRFEHALDVINTLRLTQRLPYGGEVEAKWIVSAADQLRNQATGGYMQSSELVLSGSIPLLRGAGLAAREDRIQAERDLIYAARDFERFRRELLVSIARDYFNLLQSRARIENQLRQIEGLSRDNDATEAKVKAGRLRAFQQQITASRLSQARQTLANLRENYILALDRFKLRLGLPISTPIEIDDEIPNLLEPETTLAEAALAALNFRLDLQNRRDELDDSRRGIANARNALLPDLDLGASVSIPTDPDDATGGAGIDPDELSYSVGATFSLPLDRRIERLNLRQSIISLERAQRSYDEFRDNVIIDARQAVRNIDLARFQLRLAEEQVHINELGLEELLIREDSDPQSIVDRRNDLLDAENARDQAVTDLRNAVLDYLLSTGQLRVGEDGTLAAPPGMLAPAQDEGENADEVVPEEAPGAAQP
ncbi:MAG: TolC family protein [Phycisphaerales bacterium]